MAVNNHNRNVGRNWFKNGLPDDSTLSSKNNHKETFTYLVLGTKNTCST
jgi:hypothetical protein